MLQSLEKCLSQMLVSRHFHTCLMKKSVPVKGRFERAVRFYSDSHDDKDKKTPRISRSSHFTEENPAARAGRILKGSLEELLNELNDPDKEYSGRKLFPTYCDILVIGGGAIGSSVAYWLKQRARDGLRVVVVEKDSTVIDNFYNQYKKCSTCLSVGGLRQQFSLEENIKMSLFGAEFIRNINDYLAVEDNEPINVNFTPYGYLFLASDKGAEILKTNASLQASLGAKNELLSTAMLQRKFPWLNTDGIALGCHGLENEGWFDPWLLLQAFKNKAESLGTEYVKGEVVGFKPMSTFTSLRSERYGENLEVIREVEVKLPEGEVKTIKFGMAVIAAGPQSGDVAKMIGIGVGKQHREQELPVEPRKRYVFCFHCPDGPGLNSPLTIDPNHLYFRREGVTGHYICGRSPSNDEEPDISNLDVDHSYFDEHIWPDLAKRVPAFENLKVTSSWAGYYDFNRFDENVIIGSHPYYYNIYMVTGCSGHGIQQAPALGRAMMELIINGQYTTIDLGNMSFQRLLTNTPMYERNIV